MICHQTLHIKVIGVQRGSLNVSIKNCSATFYYQQFIVLFVYIASICIVLVISSVYNVHINKQYKLINLINTLEETNEIHGRS